MGKELRKPIISRSKVSNRFLKTRPEESKKRTNRQKNFCVSLLHETKKQYFQKTMP